MTSPASPLARYRQLRDQIAGQLWQVWWPHAEAGTEACVAHLGEALYPLARSQARIEGALLVEWVARLLGGTEAERAVGLKMIGCMEERAATAPILARLAELMQDQSWWVRRAAAAAVGHLGAAAATAPFLARLAELMQDQGWLVRLAALEAVGELGAAAATAPFLARLAERLQDPDEGVRHAAAAALGELMRPFHVGALRLFGDPPVEALPVHHLSRLFTPEPAHTIP
jgi:hypothetical protein